MSIRAWLRENAADERKPRDPRFEVSLEAKAVSGDGGAVPVTVHNVSATGMLLECPDPIGTDEVLAIDLPEAPDTTATVVWASDGFCGCRFSRRLKPATLAALQLQSAVGIGARSRLSGDPGPSEPLDVRLQRLRKLRGLTLAELAARLGVSKPTVWAWEQARSSPSPDRFEKIAEVLGTSVSSLRSGREEDVASNVLERSRRQIAKAYGVETASVRIMIEL